jgi:hypothetical protein
MKQVNNGKSVSSDSGMKHINTSILVKMLKQILYVK